MSRDLVVVFHDITHARAALTAAAETSVAACLWSAPGALAVLGAPLILEIARTAAAEHPQVPLRVVVDCGADPGLALAALRAGAPKIHLNVAPDVGERVADIARRHGAAVATEPPQALDLAGCAEPLAACRNHLAGL